MRSSSWLLPLFLSLVVPVAARADDREKAEKQIRKITAMAADKTGRRMVSMSIADSYKVSRPVMVAERRTVSLNYGQYFVARELLASGIKMSDLVSGLQAGKTIWQIGDEQHADWGQIARRAKKQNGKIEDYIFRHFLNKENDEADQMRDVTDRYDLFHDAVRTDFDVTPEEIMEAQNRYVFWRTQAGKAQGSARRLRSSEEMAARMDHAQSVHDTSGGISAPAAGGAPH